MSELNLPEVKEGEKEAFFESLRNKLAMVFLAAIGVMAWFAGVFPDFQAPVIDLEVAKVFVNGASVIVTGWLVGRSMRNSPAGNGNTVLTLVSELLDMLVAANKKPFPEKEE